MPGLCESVDLNLGLADVGDLAAAASNFSLCQLEAIVGQGFASRKINVG
jgi:hypothetical protein